MQQISLVTPILTQPGAALYSPLEYNYLAAKAPGINPSMVSSQTGSFYPKVGSIQQGPEGLRRSLPAPVTPDCPRFCVECPRAGAPLYKHCQEWHATCLRARTEEQWEGDLCQKDTG